MSTAKFDTLQNAAGSKSVPVSTVVDGSAKAWVNFNGTGTVAIRAAFNVSSITDGGVGTYTINFAAAMLDTNYAVNVTARRTTANDMNFSAILKGTVLSGTNYPLTTAGCDVICGTVTNATFADSDVYCVSVFR